MTDGVWRLRVRDKARMTPKWVTDTAGGRGNIHRPGTQQREHIW